VTPVARHLRLEPEVDDAVVPIELERFRAEDWLDARADHPDRWPAHRTPEDEADLKFRLFLDARRRRQDAADTWHAAHPDVEVLGGWPRWEDYRSFRGSLGRVRLRVAL
jgi:hypothetical protein